MSRLFIHAYLDEDVNVLIARLVKHYGGNATTAVEVGTCGATDAEQLECAAGHGMSILTHNRADFEKLASEYYSAGRFHAGIIIAVRRPAHEVARRLLDLMDDVTADEMANQVRYI